MRPASGLLGQVEVVHALVLREVKTRFGRNQLGYLWALAEPILWIGTFWAMFYFLDRGAPNGMDTVMFLATGLTPYMLFRDTVSRAGSAVPANRGLLFYPQIQPLDLVIARTLLEVVTLITVFGLIAWSRVLFSERGVHVHDWLTLLWGLGSAALLGAGLGMILSGAAVFSPTVERLTGPVMRPLFWISGLYFTANGLPQPARDVFLYNPVLHCVELTRTGWFPEYQTEHASSTYLLSWIVPLFFFGMTLERVARRRLEVA